MTKMNKRLGMLTLGALVAGGGLYVWSGMNPAKATFEPSRLATVEQDTMVRSVVATGKVEPISKVEIKSKANGIIERLHFDVGDVVKAGDILVELDKENLLAQVREASANVQAADAALLAAKAQLEKNKFEAEGPDVEYAKRAAKRAEDLAAQKLVAQSEFDTAQSAYELAMNRQKVAKGQLVVAQAKVSEAAAQVAQARANLERSEEQLRNATIRAPIAGMVLTRDIEIGSPVSSILNLGANATLVMTLGDIKEVFVRGKVDEADIGQVRYEQHARISVETFKDKKFDGRVTLISPMGAEKDNVTTFEVKVSIDNPGNELKANMTANAEIILEERPNSLIVPEAAISYDAERKASVDLFDPNEPTGRRKVQVKVGISNGTRAQLLEGVKKGDRVILPA
ncbi:Macrolide-specific efflux protein MacA precursor [Luteitalea pratensis]|uniref:Macrolide-specific efflux protein MacA n=1 Tax=Luteitalea pratensis TaxID=1855912 RepID=A0A143PWJ4_LUTPR|nr:efflux RND transporter periplasmic adaptor subunit [Luteitalea pratensis]AMY12741.1 Macrolide-specific efflux protein MacA precursor [Luteitalea pratensis]